MIDWVRKHLFTSGKFKFYWFSFILLWVVATCNLVLADSELDGNPTEIEKEVLDLINTEREKNGLHPLLWDMQLYGAAHSHSEDMASENYFSHTSMNGQEYIDRIREAGYDGAIVSQNIGAGQSNAQQVFDDWMTSDDLREDMMDISYCDAAVAHTTIEDSDWTDYWTLDIGRKNGMEQCSLVEPVDESELESESEPSTEPAAIVADEPGFCEELIQRHANFCKKHPDLCRAALNKCKRSHEY